MRAGAAEELRTARAARGYQPPGAAEKIRRARDVGKLELDAAQSHESCSAIPFSVRSSAGLLLAERTVILTRISPYLF